MKKIKRNQNGYALVLVLLIITIIGIMMVPLIGSVLNNAKQNNKTEESIQLESVAKMGVVYFQNHIDVLVEKLEDVLKTELDNLEMSLRASDVPDNEIENKKNDRIVEFTEEKRIEFNKYFNTDNFNIDNIIEIKPLNSNDSVPLIVPLSNSIVNSGEDFQFSIKVEGVTKDPKVDNQFKITFNSIPSNSNGEGEPLSSEIVVSFETLSSAGGNHGPSIPDEEDVKDGDNNEGDSDKDDEIDNSENPPEEDIEDDGNGDNSEGDENEDNEDEVKFPELPTSNTCKSRDYNFPNLIYGSTCVTGDGFINNDKTINGTLDIKGNLKIGKGQGNDDTEVIINNGSLIVRDTLHLEQHTKIQINIDSEIQAAKTAAYLNNITAHNKHTSIIIEGDALIIGNISGFEEKSIKITGTEYSYQDLKNNAAVDAKYYKIITEE